MEGYKIMNNKIKKRKSQMCVKWCKNKGCFDTYEKRLIGGQSMAVWISHCIARNQLHNKILKGI